MVTMVLSCAHHVIVIMTTNTMYMAVLYNVMVIDLSPCVDVGFRKSLDVKTAYCRGGVEYVCLLATLSLGT